MASSPAIGPGAGTAAVLGAKIVHGTLATVILGFRAIVTAMAAVVGLLTGASLFGFLFRIDEPDPLHPFEQPAREV